MSPLPSIVGGTSGRSARSRGLFSRKALIYIECTSRNVPRDVPRYAWLPIWTLFPVARLPSPAAALSKTAGRASGDHTSLGIFPRRVSAHRPQAVFLDLMFHRFRNKSYLLCDLAVLGPCAHARLDPERQAVSIWLSGMAPPLLRDGEIEGFCREGFRGRASSAQADQALGGGGLVSFSIQFGGIRWGRVQSPSLTFFRAIRVAFSTGYFPRAPC